MSHLWVACGISRLGQINHLEDMLSDRSAEDEFSYSQ